VYNLSAADLSFLIPAWYFPTIVYRCGYNLFNISLSKFFMLSREVIQFEITAMCPFFSLSLFRRIRKVAKSGYYLRHVCLSFYTSTLNNKVPIRQIYIKFNFSISLKSVEKIRNFIKIVQE